ncbi:MAG: Cyclic nucleotide-binding domain protein [Syntrophorhabdus sp. PtaU1.Bin002]|nr:MAG: Cyclic nucleotide-binding domain protein [Syntrophorhabdus sp. PtaB.Bin006]OPY73899.1 MAG: Cyclic nucleotide-binding domain protein [Syntrophorhabdus sp. PtaU1.Bin002]
MAIMEASPTQESDLFKGVSNRVIAEIGRGGVELVFEPDALIFKTDDEASTIYELVEGTVEITVLEKEHIQYTVARPGEIFGWSAMIEPYVYTAMARAVTLVKAIGINRDIIEATVTRHPAEGLIIYKNLAGIIGQRLKGAYQHIYRQG